MCATHEGLLWFSDHKSLLPVDEVERSEIYTDFSRFCRCPLLRVVEDQILFDAMMEKWSGLGHVLLVEKFKVWRGSRCTYVETNQLGGCVVGGAVNTNNPTESLNAGMKAAAQNRILRLYPFCIWLQAFGAEESSNDQGFGATLNPGVNSKDFYSRVRSILQAPVSSLTVRFPDPKKPGAFLIPSLDSLLQAMGELRSDGIATTAVAIASVMTTAPSDDSAASESDDDLATGRALGGDLSDDDERVPLKDGAAATRLSWLSFYLRFREDPGRYIPASFDFDDAVTWSSAFYSLYPITDENYLRRLYIRLASTGMGLMPVVDVIALGTSGLMACGCPSFLQRAWCKHSCADAAQKKIITKYPSTMLMDPTPLAKKDFHKNKKSKKGGARGYE